MLYLFPTMTNGACALRCQQEPGDLAEGNMCGHLVQDFSNYGLQNKLAQAQVDSLVFKYNDFLKILRKN